MQSIFSALVLLIILILRRVSAYSMLYVKDLWEEQMVYFGQWTLDPYEDFSRDYFFWNRKSYIHIFENKVQQSLSKLYKTDDPHYKMTIAFDLMLVNLNKNVYDEECTYWQDPNSHLNNPLCTLSYDWDTAVDQVVVLIDGLYIYYEVCNDQCNCLSCSSSGNCQQCPYQQFYNTSTKSCQSCPPNCFTCSNSSTCLNCLDGYFLNTSNNACEDATLHPNAVGIFGNWVAAPANCLIWDDTGACKVTSLPTTNTCDSVLNCQTCSQLMSCDSCPLSNPFYYNQICSAHCKVEGYYEIAATGTTKAECGVCDYTCLTCSGSQPNQCLTCDLTNRYFNDPDSTCFLCEDTHYPDDQHNTCVLCNVPLTGCFRCQNSGGPYCTQCSDGYYLFLGVCYSDCSTFTNTKPFASPINRCVVCYEGCLSCNEFIWNNECTICAPTFYRYQDMCLTSCDDIPGTYADPTTMACLKCQDFNCLKCLGAGTSKCTKCGSYTILTSSNTCQYCGTRQAYISYTQICVDCPSHCEFCTDASICQYCDIGYFQDFQVLNSPCVAVCSGTQIGDTTKRQCVKCPAGTVKNVLNQTCVPCETGCQICEINGKCTQCFPNYILNSCSSAGKQCTQCPYPNQYSVGSNSQCFNCDPICKTCSGQGQLNCIECADGYFKAGDLCLQCDISCKTCDKGPTFCTTCQTGYNYISYRSSLPTAKYMECFQTCPASQNTNTQNNTCFSCNFTCLTCSGPLPTNCVTCIDYIGGYRVYMTSDNQCVLECPIGTYADGPNKACKNCDPTCSQCQGPAPTDCTVCAKGYIYRPTSKLCVSACPPGEYADTATNTCQACMSICQTCIVGDKCTSCYQPLYLSSDFTQCLTQCPSSQYQNETLHTCLVCPANCVQCTSSKNCTLCKTGYLIQQGQCVQSCQRGFYQDPNSLECLPCSTDCAYCTETVCTECEYTSYVILGKICVSSCPTGQVNYKGKCLTTKEDMERYQDCYEDCEQEVQFADNSDNTVKSIELSQASMNGLALFFGGLGNYFFYWLQMQQIMGDMVFLQNTKALGIGSLHLKTLYMENLFNIIPIVAPNGDVIKTFEQRTEAILPNLQPQSIYTYFVQNCQYSIGALTLGIFIIPILYLLSRDSEFCHLLYLYCKWNVVIRLIMICSNFFLLCTFFKFKYGTMSGGGMVAADFICIAGFLLIYVGMFSFLTYCNRSQTISNQTQMSINAFYYDIETSTVMQKSFWVIFEVRKFIVVSLVVITNGSAVVPWIYLVLCILFLAYHYKYNPFKKLLLQRYIFVSEVLNILCVLFLGLTVSLYQSKSSVYYAYIFVILLIVYQLWAFVTQLYQLARLFITLFLKYRVPKSPVQHRNRTVSHQPFLLKRKMSKTNTEEIIKQLNDINLTDMKLESAPNSPRKKRETQGIYKIQ